MILIDFFMTLFFKTNNVIVSFSEHGAKIQNYFVINEKKNGKMKKSFIFPSVEEYKNAISFVNSFIIRTFAVNLKMLKK